jgi:hypothetical protein
MTLQQCRVQQVRAVGGSNDEQVLTTTLHTGVNQQKA